MRHHGGVGILAGILVLLFIQPILGILFLIWIWSITPWWAWILIAGMAGAAAYGLHKKALTDNEARLEQEAREDALIGSTVQVIHRGELYSGKLVCYDRISSPTTFKYGVDIEGNIYYFTRVM